MSKRRARTRRWAHRQDDDVWVRKARARGLPSRSAFKLEEIIARQRLIRRGGRVLELGAAPGGWTQLAARAAGREGRIVAVDRLRMAAPAGVRFVRGDVAEQGVREKTLKALGGAADVVLSDLAPNLTGIVETDALNAAGLGNLAADMAVCALKPGGSLLVKTFTGEGGDELRRRLCGEYRRVRTLKPEASRAASREFYLLATGFTAPSGMVAGPANTI